MGCVSSKEVRVEPATSKPTVEDNFPADDHQQVVKADVSNEMRDSAVDVPPKQTPLVEIAAPTHSSDQAKEQCAVVVDPNTLAAWVSQEKMQDLETLSFELIQKLAGNQRGGITAEHFQQLESAATTFTEYQNKMTAFLDQAVKVHESVADVVSPVKDTIDGLITGIGLVADLHPILKISWFIVSAGYKIAKAASEIDAEFQTLVERFAEASKQIDRLKNLPARGIPEETRKMFAECIDSYIACLIDVVKLYLGYISKNDGFGKRLVSSVFGNDRQQLTDINDRLDSAAKNMQRVKEDGQFEILTDMAANVSDVKEIVFVTQEQTATILDMVTALNGPSPEDEVRKEQDSLRERCKYTELHNHLEASQKRSENTRDWILARLKDAVLNGEKNIVWLKGGAGLGKSVIAGSFANSLEDGLLGATFFCQKGDPSRNTTSAIVQTIAYAFASTDRTFRSRLLQSVIDSKTENPSIHDIVRLFLTNPFHNWPATQTRVFVIDGLDQLIDQENINIVLEGFHRLGTHIKLLVTSQPGVRVSLKGKKEYHHEVLNASDPQNIEDLTLHIGEYLRSYPDAIPSEDVDILVPAFVQASKGSFMWSNLVLERGEDSEGKSAVDAISAFEQPLTEENLAVLIDALTQAVPQDVRDVYFV